MKLETKNSSRTKILLSSIIALAVTFIISSIVLMTKVNKTQEKVKRKVSCIYAATDIEDIAQKQIINLSSTNSLDLKLVEEIKIISKEFAELKVVSQIISQLNIFEDKNLSFTEKAIIQQQLIAIESFCEDAILRARNEMSDHSEILANYWNYTHVTLVIACVLILLLAIISLYVAKTKRLLLEEKSKNKFIFNNSITLFSSSDVNGQVTDFNPAAQNAFGYSLEEIRNLDFRELYHDFDDFKKVRDSLSQNGFFSGEIINKHKDGSLFVCFLSANSIFDEEGNEIGTMGISRDITKEKIKEQEFQNIVNNAQDIIYTVSPEGKFTFVNSSGSFVMGFENKELIGRFFTDLVHPEQIDKVRKFYIDQFRTKTKASYLEFKGVTKNKEIVWLGQNITSLFSPSDPNKIIGFQGVVRNINKRKRAEHKLKKSEESFRIIVNTINDLFYLFDFRTDRFEYISPNAEQVLGIKQEFFYSGNSFFNEFIQKEDLPVAMKAEGQLLRGESYNIEYRVVANGRTRWIHDRAFPIKNESGRVISYSGVSRDITDVKSAMLIIEQQNDEINQSISYAKNIQNSTLLDLEEIVSIYPDCFIYFNPRDVLSGDFYLLDNFKTTEFGTLTAFVVADCTGHGVPGGMLSFLCNSLLREAFDNSEVNSTSEVLDFAKSKLGELFRSNSENHIHDGMDVALCAMTEDRSTLYFSGANLPLTIIRDGDIFEIRGDRQHVGYSRKVAPFETQVVDLQKNDMIYLFSDGYQDQFGGEKGKKFMKRRLKELLIRIHEKPLEEQYNNIKLEFHDWKGELHQVDDICVMGIRV